MPAGQRAGQMVGNRGRGHSARAAEEEAKERRGRTWVLIAPKEGAGRAGSPQLLRGRAGEGDRDGACDNVQRAAGDVRASKWGQKRRRRRGQATTSRN